MGRNTLSAQPLVSLTPPLNVLLQNFHYNGILEQFRKLGCIKGFCNLAQTAPLLGQKPIKLTLDICWPAVVRCADVVHVYLNMFIEFQYVQYDLLRKVEEKLV